MKLTELLVEVPEPHLAVIVFLAFLAAFVLCPPYDDDEDGKSWLELESDSSSEGLSVRSTECPHPRIRRQSAHNLLQFSSRD